MRGACKPEQAGMGIEGGGLQSQMAPRAGVRSGQEVRVEAAAWAWCASLPQVVPSTQGRE